MQRKLVLASLASFILLTPALVTAQTASFRIEEASIEVRPPPATTPCSSTVSTLTPGHDLHESIVSLGPCRQAACMSMSSRRTWKDDRRAPLLN